MILAPALLALGLLSRHQAATPAIPTTVVAHAAPHHVSRLVVYPDNIQGWTAQAFAILKASGVPASQLGPAHANAVSIIAFHESGDNPSMGPGNPLYNCDSNCASGDASQGLMQMIPPGFQAYALPGHTNILNPVDSIIAATRYSIDRYGGLSNVPGVVSVLSGGSYIGY